MPKVVKVQDVPLNSEPRVLNKYLSPGKLLEVRVDDSYLAAVVSALHEPALGHAADVQYQVVDEKGETRFVRASQVVVVMPGANYEPSAARKFAKMAAAADPALLRNAWKHFSEAENGPPFLDILTICKAMHGNTKATSLYITHRLLTADRTYFHRLKTRPPTFRAREEPEVLRNLANQKLEAERETERKECAAALTAARHAASKPSQDEWLAGPHAETLTHLRNYAAGVDAAPHGSAAFAMLDLGFELSTIGAAQLLREVGYWPRHLPIAWLKQDLPTDFPHFVLARAEKVTENPPTDELAALRQDLTRHVTLAIDDDRTTEVDDAVSVEALPGGGWRVWVHVSQPCACVELGDPLDLEARRRSKTLYLPWTRVMMFPPVLSEGRFALSGGKPSDALTFVADVDSSGALIAYDVIPSTVLPTTLEYNDADRILANKAPHRTPSEEAIAALRALHECAQRRTEHRRRNGSCDIANLECEVTVSDVNADTPAVAVSTISVSDSPARWLVMEMMVLAGEVGAKFAADRGVPMPFRHQPAPTLPADWDPAKYRSAYARGYALRRYMVKSGVSTERPQKHHGLGLDAYVQVTSPIRRYHDLLAHYQLKAALLGKTPPHSCSTLLQATERSQDIVKEYGRLEGECRAHFMAYYFHANPKTIYEGEILGGASKNPPSATVLIKQLGMEVRILLPPGFAANPGSKCMARVRDINLSAGSFEWELVK